MSELQSYSSRKCQEVLDGTENPFWTLEALGEHVQACWHALAEQYGASVWDLSSGHNERPKGSPGELRYHLNAIDQYEQKLLNVFAALLPAVRDFAEGYTTTITDAERQRLRDLIAYHEAEYERVRSFKP